MSERQGGLGPHRPTEIIRDEAVEHAAIVPAGMPLEEATAKIIDAAGKGRLALLVTDAAGNVVVGLQATGGLTELRHRPADNLWTFAGAFGGTPVVLEGSVALRNALGTEADQTPDDFGDPADDPVRAVVPLPELEPGYVPMPPHPEYIEDFGQPPWGAGRAERIRRGLHRPELPQPEPPYSGVTPEDDTEPTWGPV